MSGLQSGEDSAGTATQHDATPSQQVSQVQNAHTATATATPTNTSKRPEWLEIILTTLQDQWFLVGIGVVITIASQVQVPREHQKIKETLTTYLMVSIIFFLTGCTLDTRVLIQNYSRWKVHLFVQGQCFLMTSAIAFGVVSATATSKDFVDPGLLVGLIFFGCVATTMSSNVVMTRQAHGNSALTVVQTTLGNFIGVSHKVLSCGCAQASSHSTAERYLQVMEQWVCYGHTDKKVGLRFAGPCYHVYFCGHLVQQRSSAQYRTIRRHLSTSVEAVRSVYLRAYGCRAGGPVLLSAGLSESLLRLEGVEVRTAVHAGHHLADIRRRLRQRCVRLGPWQRHDLHSFHLPRPVHGLLLRGLLLCHAVVA